MPIVLCMLSAKFVTHILYLDHPRQKESHLVAQHQGLVALVEAAAVPGGSGNGKQKISMVKT